MSEKFVHYDTLGPFPSFKKSSFLFVQAHALWVYAMNGIQIHHSTSLNVKHMRLLILIFLDFVYPPP